MLIEATTEICELSLAGLHILAARLCWNQAFAICIDLDESFKFLSHLNSTTAQMLQDQGAKGICSSTTGLVRPVGVVVVELANGIVSKSQKSKVSRSSLSAYCRQQ